MRTYFSKSAQRRAAIRNTTEAAIDTKRQRAGYVPRAVSPPLGPNCIEALWDGNYRVPRGKYSGRTWRRVPASYLEWLASKNTTMSREAVMELERRRLAGEELEAPREMPFGKYCGKRFEDIPEQYLQWVVGNVEGQLLVTAVEDHLRLRARQFEPAGPDVGNGWDA